MCIATPGRIISVSGQIAAVDVDGVQLEAVVAMIENPQVGDYVLLHAGFAIHKWSEEDFVEFQNLIDPIKASKGSFPATPSSENENP